MKHAFSACPLPLLEERPGLLIIPRGIRQPLLEQLTRRRVPLAEIVKVEWGGRVVVLWELHGRVHAPCLLWARKNVSSSILPEARGKSTLVQVSSNGLKVPMESAIDRRKVPSPAMRERGPRAGGGSAAQDSLGLDIEGIDRLARSHEQAVALLATETHVGTALGQQDAADHRAVGRVDGDPVLSLAAGPGAPDVAVRVDPEAVAAARLGATELAPVGHLGAIVDDIVDLDRPLPRAGGVDDVEPCFVG